jgi:hypothetical protein
LSREYNVELAEVTFAHCVQNIYIAEIEPVNVLAKMQDSTALAEGTEAPPSVVRQIAAEQARLEEDREVVHLEREELEKEREDGAKTVANLEARLAAMSREKVDLEKRLLVQEIEVKKLRRDVGEIPKMNELSALRDSSSKTIPEFLSSTAFQVATLNAAKSVMLDQLHTTVSYISEYFPFEPEEFGVQATTVEPPSLAGYTWNRKADQLVSAEGTTLSVPEILPELRNMQPKTP